MAEMSDEMWEYVKKQYEELDYGEIRLVANEQSKGVDVIVQKRQRFEKQQSSFSRDRKFKHG